MTKEFLDEEDVEDILRHQQEPDDPDEPNLDEDPADIPQHAEDIGELSSLLEAATAATQEERRLKQARKRLTQIQKHDHPNQREEQTALLAEIRRLEESRVWQTIGCVALFYTQRCTTCDSKHDFFMGWFIVRTHATDKHLRDLKAGEPVERLPRWIEVTDRGSVSVCANCCELRIAAEVAMGTYPEV